MIDNTDNIIDSRDIIDRIEEIESDIDELFSDEDLARELKILKLLEEECVSYNSYWGYGVSLIHEKYFESYADEIIVDCYSLPTRRIPHWLIVTVDYDALKQDYVEVDFDGETYYIEVN